jgi:hypothetical protein
MEAEAAWCLLACGEFTLHCSTVYIRSVGGGNRMYRVRQSQGNARLPYDARSIDIGKMP